MSWDASKPKISLLKTSMAVYTVLLALAACWYICVNQVVPEPYLDEVFHIRQASVWWANQWEIWDPKITTPAGLYLISYPWLGLLQFLRFSNDMTRQLRSLNVGAAAVLFFVVHRLLFSIIANRDDRKSSSSFTHLRRGLKWSEWELIHAVFNICLFPPLFFFYALFYTDVLSVIFVLFTYYLYFTDKREALLFSGMLALLFRQTNIFWTGVFLGGLETIRNIRSGRFTVEFPPVSTFSDVMSGSWHHACLYDPLVRRASFQDYLKTSISLVIATLASLHKVLQHVSPYLVILASFGMFVLWNEGVVLGDKENHIASLHLPQMLYIWPYFAFFSFPLLYPYVLNCLAPQTSLPRYLRSGSTAEKLPHLAIVAIVLGIIVAIVHNNTLVHPFTLADNRHYIFYIFRILLRHPLVKYLATPIYLICGWSAITAVGGLPNTEPLPERDSISYDKNGFQILPGLPKPEEGNRVSFVVVWLIATTLSLITAPLVEPRYFIVPWIIWRLHITTPRPHEGLHGPPTQSNSWLDKIKAIAYKEHDHRLWLETFWFLAVNFVTGYVFLNWGFEWPQEPGRVQRFMW